MVREIVLPETKPETEWLRGRAVRKMSPRRTHARLQDWWLKCLQSWAGDRGDVLPEWRFRIGPPGEDIRPLVPDVAYLSYERMGDTPDAELELPRIPPNVAVEIRSPGDSRRDVMEKADVLLRAGCDVVIIVNPRTKTIIARDAERTTIFSPGDVFAHAALPGLRFDPAACFSRP